MSDPKTDKNYEDLKAKLGIKKREIAPAPATSSAAGGADAQEGPTEHTPAGGFDLGLERGGGTVDPAVLEAERAAAALSANDLQIKMSGGTKAMFAFVVVVLCGLAYYMGSSMKAALYDRMIADKQVEDAENYLKAIQSQKVGRTGESLQQATDAFIAAINGTTKRIEQAKKADSVTPALLKSLEKELNSLRDASIAYVEKKAHLEDIFSANKEVYNGQALQAAVSYDQALWRLYNSALLMANEKGVLIELQEGFDPKTIQIAPRVRQWRWASIVLKDGSRKGFLVGVKPVVGADGKFVSQERPAEVVPGVPPDPNIKPTRQIKVKYDDPKQVGKEEDWVDEELLAEYDLQPDIADDVKNLVAQQQGMYEQLLLKRLFDRVTHLKSAADGVPNARQKAFDTLAKLAGKQ